MWAPECDCLRTPQLHPRPRHMRANPGAWHLPHLLSPLLNSCPILPSGPSLTSVFHSPVYLAFLWPGLRQLGNNFGPELGTISEEFPYVNGLTLCWVRVGGFDSCSERCWVLGWDGWWTCHKFPVCLQHKSKGCTSSEARKWEQRSQVNRPESTGVKKQLLWPCRPQPWAGFPESDGWLLRSHLWFLWFCEVWERK